MEPNYIRHYSTATALRLTRSEAAHVPALTTTAVHTSTSIQKKIW